MHIRYLVVLMLFFRAGFSFSQTPPSAIDFGFIKHLMTKGMHDEALYLLNQRLKSLPIASEAKLDSIHYFSGRAYCETKDLEQSSQSYLKVSPQSSFHFESRFFSSYNYFYLNKPDKAVDILNNLPPFDRPLLNELISFQKAGGALLKRDYDQFESYADKFTYKFYQLENEQKILTNYYEEMTSFNKKSMALAGIMSAIVPGTGKMYTGKAGEGLSALLTNAILGAITVENYLKGGMNNPKTIIFGSLFTVFYLGNIYGSMVSVKVYREEYYESIERKILFHIHIPLRTVFNQ